VVQFATDKPHRSRTPEVVVENPLKPGRYRFSLVVVDTSDNESEPFELAVSVVEETRTTVLRPELIREATILRRPTPEPRPIVVDRLRPIRPIRPS
jgi:hypothetical protein